MGVSIRRACRVFGVDTSTYHYKARRLGQAGLEGRIKEICETRVRLTAIGGSMCCCGGRAGP
jgi:putative transposase